MSTGTNGLIASAFSLAWSIIQNPRQVSSPSGRSDWRRQKGRLFHRLFVLYVSLHCDAAVVSAGVFLRRYLGHKTVLKGTQRECLYSVCTAHEGHIVKIFCVQPFARVGLVLWDCSRNLQCFATRIYNAAWHLLRGAGLLRFYGNRPAKQDLRNSDKRRQMSGK